MNDNRLVLYSRFLNVDCCLFVCLSTFDKRDFDFRCRSNYQSSSCNSQSSLKSCFLQRDLLQWYCLTKLIVIVVEILHWLSWWIIDVLRVRDNVRRSRRIRRVRRVLSLLLRNKSMFLDTFVFFVHRAIREIKSSCENCFSKISFDL